MEVNQIFKRGADTMYIGMCIELLALDYTNVFRIISFGLQQLCEQVRAQIAKNNIDFSV